jgi:DNA-binding NarL/FixJ family response regulator
MSEFDVELRILIVADDSLARAGLATLLADQSECTVVGQVSGASDLAAALDVYLPDLVLWDLGWEPAISLETLAELAEGGPPIVALLPDETNAAEAWAAGARGLLLREVSVERLVAALGSVVQGLVALDPSLSDVLRSSGDQAPVPLAEPLTPRESEVLQLLAEGLSNRAIAYRLGISEHTVKFHVNAIMNKLGAQSRTEAAVRATRMGLLLI